MGCQPHQGSCIPKHEQWWCYIHRFAFTWKSSGFAGTWSGTVQPRKECGFRCLCFLIVCGNSFPFSVCLDLNKAHFKIQTIRTAHVEAVLDHPTWLYCRSSEAAWILGGHPQFSLLTFHCLWFRLQCCVLLHSHVDATERQINVHKEQERRKKARGIHQCAELPDNPSGGFKSFVSSRGFL